MGKQYTSLKYVMIAMTGMVGAITMAIGLRTLQILMSV